MSEEFGPSSGPDIVDSVVAAQRVLDSHAPARIAEDKPRRKRCALSVEQRVRHIEGMMESLTFQRGKTCRLLAAEWGLGVAAVESNAAEASRRVLGDKDAARNECARDIAVGARRLLRSAVVARDARAFEAVSKIWASVTGASSPERNPDAPPVRDVLIRVVGPAVADDADAG